jgi:hypothetical protein
MRFPNGETGIIEGIDDRAEAMQEAEVRFQNGAPVDAVPVYDGREDDIDPGRGLK